MALWKARVIATFSFLPYRLAKTVARAAMATQGIGFAGQIQQSGEAALLRKLRTSGVFGAQPVFVDVGAHVGEYVEIIKSLWPDATVYAFEPSTAHYNKLVSAVANLSKVFVYNAGLSSESGERTLHKPEEISGLASLEIRDIRHLGIESHLSEQVRITTLETVARDEGIAKVSFMKVDIEGHELSCFKGAAALIRNRLIKMVQFEYGHAHIASKTSVFDLFETFVPFGYQMGAVKPNGDIVRFQRYDEFLETHLATNYVAMLPEIASKL